MPNTELMVASLTWLEVRDKRASGAMAVLPVGAGSKQHGPHLPMGTDLIQAEWFARRGAERFGGLVWPTLTYGYYPAFVAYAGSISIGADHFEAIIRDIVSSLLHSGAKKVLVVNAGLSSVAPIDRALAQMRNPTCVAHAGLYSGAAFKRKVSEIAEQSHGSHADEIETSIMLAIAPQVVRLSRAVASPKLDQAPVPGPLNPHDEHSPNYSPLGSFGDPRLATAAKGHLLVEAILQDLAAVADRLAAS